MTEAINAVVAFIAEHGPLAGLFVFLTAFAESIAVVGSLIPGAAILIGVGAVIGLGHLQLWPVLFAATVGAIAGDTLSYWLGRRYRDSIVGVWPFSRRPQLLVQAEVFLGRHGTKSVVVGRFAPMLRAFVPLAAGVLGMQPPRFMTACVTAGAVWAVAHVLPGALLGVSLGVVGDISKRLLAALLGLALVTLGAAWLLKLAVLRGMPRLSRTQEAIVDWARTRQGWLPRLVVLALDPRDRYASTVLTLALALLVTVLGFFAVLHGALSDGTIAHFDTTVGALTRGIRTGWADSIMVSVTALGDNVVTIAVTLAAVAWLAWRRAWTLAAGLVLAVGGGLGFVALLRAVLHVPRPVALMTGIEAFGFPSGHAAEAAALYGILAWLLATGLPARWRWLPPLVGGALIGAIAASRIYLGAHWPSDVIAGLLFGFAVVALFVLVFHRAALAALQPVGLAAAVFAALVVVGAWHARNAYDVEMTAYANQIEPMMMSRRGWLAAGWHRLPTHRIDLRGEVEEPFVLQWAGTRESLREHLTEAGWRTAPNLSPQNAMRMALYTARIDSLPVMPLLHDGRRAELTFLVPREDDEDGEQRMVFRAWPSGYYLRGEGKARTILVGSVRREHVERPWRLLSIPRSQAIDEDTQRRVRVQLVQLLTPHRAAEREDDHGDAIVLGEE